MDVDKFEYWAKRQGMSCVKSSTKGAYFTYTSEDTERAFLYWLDAFSPLVEYEFNYQKALKIKHKNNSTTNDTIIEVVTLVVNDLCDTTKNLDWLYKFSTKEDVDHEFVLRSLKGARSSSIKYLKLLGEMINLRDLFVWQTRDDYPRIRAKVSNALRLAANPVYSNGALEAAIANKFNGVVFLQRGDKSKDAMEYKFSENVIDSALELSL